jgi:3-oxoacyl-[acyl-carrier protein] reductase
VDIQTPDELTTPMRGRAALVTGVSRRGGIGFAIARRLASLGAGLVLAHHAAHDADQPWGADDLSQVLAEVGAARADPSQPVADLDLDLADPVAPAALMEAARRAVGHVDMLVCNHARSGGDAGLADVTAGMLDRHYAVNTRSSLLLASAFAAQHDGRPGGRVVFLTSGQAMGPMPGEVAYAAAKGALAAITLTVADELADRGITVNCVNPGPVDTGYVTAELRAAVAPMFPFGRWGVPDDAARLIAFLLSEEGRWITGQVINSEGGFARWRAGR